MMRSEVTTQLRRLASSARPLLIPLTLLLFGVGLHHGRVRFIRSWFAQGPARPASRATTRSVPRPAARPLSPVRVLLVDGLGERVADRLPGWQRLCGQGLSLRVDVGFPSVSLPVQHVLWTGAWQTQSGVEFAVAQLARPVFESLPELVTRRSANAVAVADAHREIVASFPFSQTVAPVQRSFSPLTLQQEALLAARSRAPLVFIHATSVDRAGHRFGALSPEYQAAARATDELLQSLLQIRQPDWTLFALSDHGHLPQGGHGDLEDEVRWARACVAGPGLAAGRSGRAIMPDLTALLAERLGTPAPSASVGRPLAALLGGEPAPVQPGTRPPLRNAFCACLVGALLVLALLGALQRAGRRGWMAGLALFPSGLMLSLAVLLQGHGWPSLSRAYVYPSVSWPLLTSAIPGALLVGLQLRTLLRRGVALLDGLALLLCGAVGPALLLVLLAGWPLQRPPLYPFWSGWGSTLLELAAMLAAALGAWTVIYHKLAQITAGERPADPR